MRTHHTFVGLLIRSAMAVILGIGLALLLNTKSVAGDIALDSIQTKTDLYENVTVTGHNETDIFILHSQGMANVKIKDLDAETLWRVGLGDKPLEPGSPEALAAAEAEANKGMMPAALTKMFGSTSSAAATAASPADPAMESDMESQVLGMTGGNSTGMPANFQLSPEQRKQFMPILIGVMGGSFVAYLFSCFCLRLIVKKAGTKPGLMIWLPVLQLIPMLRAASMSGWWLGGPLLALLAIGAAGTLAPMAGETGGLLLMAVIPALIATWVTLFIGQILWCVKIVQARGKSVWVTIFLILPVTNLFAFLYLAFSSAGHSDEDAGDNSDRILIQSPFADA